MEDIKKQLHEDNFSCVIENGGVIRTLTQHGVADLYDLLKIEIKPIGVPWSNASNPGMENRPIYDNDSKTTRGMSSFSLENNYERTPGALNFSTTEAITISTTVTKEYDL